MRTALLGVALVLSAGGTIVKAAEPFDPKSKLTAPASRDSDQQQHATNPLTGKALSLEHKQLQLEEAKLEEQLAAADFNRKKFQVEIKRLDAELSHTREPQAAAVSMPLGPSDASVDSGDLAALSAKRLVSRLSGGNGQTLAELRRDAAGRRYWKTGASRTTPIASPRVVGVMRSNGKDYALVDLAGRTLSVAAGDSVGGQRVGRINDSSVVIGGVSHAIGQSVARVETTDRSRATLRSTIARGNPEASDLTALPLLPASSIPDVARTLERAAGKPFDARLPDVPGR
jgi:hypothetical protein